MAKAETTEKEETPDGTLTPPPDETPHKEEWRSVVRSAQDRLLVTLKPRGKGPVRFVDLEPLGDAEYFHPNGINTRKVGDGTEFLDVEVNGQWVRASIDENPPGVDEHVE